MKCLVYLCCLLLSLNIKQALGRTDTTDNYGGFFLLQPPRQAISTQNKLKINLHYNLQSVKEDRFRIKAILKNGGTLINGKNGGWLDMPTLSKELELILSPNALQDNLWVEVQDITTGKVYKSQEVKVWSPGNYISYINKLNESIMSRGLDDRILEWNNSKDGLPP